MRKNPDGILIFDEIEKADRKVIHLFLQILDRGLLHNDFLDQDEDFSESIIIFTSNAGKALYEDGTSGDYTRMPKSVLLDAIRKDKNHYVQPSQNQTSCENDRDAVRRSKQGS